jgi:hypothetical protein
MKNKVRNMNGIPLIILARSAINIESPSIYTMKCLKESNSKQDDLQLKRIQTIKEKTIKPEAPKPVFKRKKAKGPNPLSCKKSNKKRIIKTKDKISK